ncbi:MAG: OmpA family protein [Thermodesulfobacteriota bacterium]|nr:OmpA family protein [Thermodesulfobacteriota bacterium]
MARKRKQPQEETAGSGMLQMMTVSLFIILLAFFILLNAFAVVDDLRRREAIGSIRDAFGFLSGGYSVIKWSDESLDEESSNLRGGGLDFSAVAEGVGDQARITNNLSVSTGPRGTSLRIAASLLFDQYESELKPGAGSLLDNLCEKIREGKDAVEISGHMDNVPIYRKTGMTIRELSALRALRVLQYFKDNCGVAAERLTAFGWGDQKPVYANNTIRTRRLNRRIEILFPHEKSLGEQRGVFTFEDFFFNVFSENQ